MSKHTPGPWVITEDNCGECAIDSGDFHICQTFGFCHDEEALANANLIAAAPDLLEALEDMTGRFERCCRYTDSADEEMLAEITKPIRELIAKAKGE